MRAPQTLELAYHHRGGFHALKHLVLVREIELMDAALDEVEGSRHSRRTAARAPRPSESMNACPGERNNCHFLVFFTDLK